MREINLLGFEKKKLAGFYQKAKIFKIAVIAIDFILVLVMAVFLLVYFDSTKKLRGNEVRINLLISEINKLNKRESYLVTIENRLAKIDGILKVKVPLSEFLAKIKELLVEGYFFSSLDISSQKQAAMVGSCLDSRCLSELYAKAEEMKTKKPFSEFIFNSVSRRLNDPFEIGISLKN